MGKKAKDQAKRPKRRSRPVEHWKEDPEPHDFPAAADYLTLVLEPDLASETIASLMLAATIHRKAKDLLRASRLPLLDETNVHVAGDLQRVRRGERLSPVLLVRGDLGGDEALTIADGYHRICASYHLDEDADIPCRMVTAPRRGR